MNRRLLQVTGLLMLPGFGIACSPKCPPATPATQTANPTAVVESVGVGGGGHYLRLKGCKMTPNPTDQTKMVFTCEATAALTIGIDTVGLGGGH